MPPAIVVENLGKSYRVQHEQVRGGYRTLRESLTGMAAKPFNRIGSALAVRPSPLPTSSEEFWALKDVSFEVQSGDVVGIIGRNGAGKSTLLKIISRITKPTSGRATLRGRVGSLLEVSTGFHPELTGRENIFMNGSILGMSRREIQRKFDEIVDFSGVEQFLDTPVKRYSSGMYVRLAFSVAAHLEPEILIVDEVLAVGDISFQRKCLGRMKDVSRGGRTVLFVSHNMGAVEALCDRAILLHMGHVAAIDTTKRIIERYYDECRASEKAINGSAGMTLSSRGGAIRRAILLDPNGRETFQVPLGDVFLLQLDLSFADEVRDPVIGVGIDDSIGNRVLTLHTPVSDDWTRRLHGRCTVQTRVAQFPLAPGEYRIKIAISAQTEPVDVLENALSFSVVDRDAFGAGRGFHAGVCVAPSAWTVSSR